MQQRQGFTVIHNLTYAAEIRVFGETGVTAEVLAGQRVRGDSGAHDLGVGVAVETLGYDHRI